MVVIMMAGNAIINPLTVGFVFATKTAMKMITDAIDPLNKWAFHVTLFLPLGALDLFNRRFTKPTVKCRTTDTLPNQTGGILKDFLMTKATMDAAASQIANTIAKCTNSFLITDQSLGTFEVIIFQIIKRQALTN